MGGIDSMVSLLTMYGKYHAPTKQTLLLYDDVPYRVLGNSGYRLTI